MTSLQRSAALAGTYLILTFPIAAIWHLVLFPDVYAAANLRPEPLVTLGLLSTVLQALAVAYVFPRIHGGGAPMREGVRFGLVMGTFIGSYGVLAEAGKFDVGPLLSWVIFEGLFFLVQWLIIGVAIAFVYERLTRNARQGREPRHLTSESHGIR
jgi:hypothetical protein